MRRALGSVGFVVTMLLAGGAQGAGIPDEVVDLVSLDMRLHLPTGTHIVPFLQAGGLLGWIGRDNRMPSASGAGFEAGGGIEGWVGEYVTLGTKVRYRGLQATEPSSVRGNQGSFVHMLTTSIELGVHF